MNGESTSDNSSLHLPKRIVEKGMWDIDNMAIGDWAKTSQTRATAEKGSAAGDKPDDSGSVRDAEKSDENKNSSEIDRICTPTLEDVQAVEDWAYTRLDMSV